MIVEFPAFTALCTCDRNLDPPNSTGVLEQYATSREVRCSNHTDEVLVLFHVAYDFNAVVRHNCTDVGLLQLYALVSNA
ncbi:hypothetical protein, partial [Actinomadura meyerae]|uniref:hypothetical protein n=1 Tax=Actinomadura meyerae TaxID=240840 RepID=UPI001C534015